MGTRDPFALRLCVALIATFSMLVPALGRANWRCEWEREIR